MVDLDGVLNEYVGIYNELIIPPIKIGAQEFLQKLSKKYKIFIFTSRPYAVAKKWVMENGLGLFVEDVTSVKLPASLYINGRAICHNVNFDTTLLRINNFKVHWAD